MSYGFSAVNSSGSILVSSSARVLVYRFRGQGRLTSRYTNRPGYMEVVFSSPVTSVTPPHIFIRVLSASHSSCAVITAVSGTPGNWTGFTLTSGVLGGSRLQDFLIDYVVCSTEPKVVSPTGYGFNILDEAGASVFNSSEKVCSTTKWTKKWRNRPYWFDSYYGGYRYLPTDASGNDMSIAVDEYCDITAVSSGFWLSWVRSIEYAAVVIWQDNANTLQIDHQGGVQNLRAAPADLNFSVPICKFPLSRYAA